MKITFVRHGETENNLSGILIDQLGGVLTKKGIAQAKKLGKRLSKEKFDIIYCSDSSRTKQTAKEIIKHHKKVPIIYSEELRELSRGDFVGKHGKELWNVFLESGEDFAEFKPKNGESPNELKHRIKKFLKKTHKKHKGEHILFVTHGGVGRSIWYICNNKKIKLSKDIRDKTQQDNCCVNILEFINNKPKLVLYNCMEHLI